MSTSSTTVACASTTPSTGRHSSGPQARRSSSATTGIQRSAVSGGVGRRTTAHAQNHSVDTKSESTERLRALVSVTARNFTSSQRLHVINKSTIASTRAQSLGVTSHIPSCCSHCFNPLLEYLFHFADMNHRGFLLARLSCRWCPSPVNESGVCAADRLMGPYTGLFIRALGRAAAAPLLTKSYGRTRWRSGHSPDGDGGVQSPMKSIDCCGSTGNWRSLTVALCEIPLFTF